MKKLIIAAIIIGTVILAGNALVKNVIETSNARTTTINNILDKLN
jgi:outer membrane murein-binding lipoprotein Lpp